MKRKGAAGVLFFTVSPFSMAGPTMIIAFVLGLSLPMLLAAGVLARPAPASPATAPVASSRRSAGSTSHLFQGGQLNETAVEIFKVRFRDLLERAAKPAAVEASLRPGTHFVFQVRALAEIGTDQAGNILERQLQRRLTDDPLEQYWYWIDLASSLRCSIARKACRICCAAPRAAATIRWATSSPPRRSASSASPAICGKSNAAGPVGLAAAAPRSGRPALRPAAARGHRSPPGRDDRGSVGPPARTRSIRCWSASPRPSCGCCGASPHAERLLARGGRGAGSIRLADVPADRAGAGPARVSATRPRRSCSISWHFVDPASPGRVAGPARSARRCRGAELLPLLARRRFWPRRPGDRSADLVEASRRSAPGCGSLPPGRCRWTGEPSGANGRRRRGKPSVPAQRSLPSDPASAARPCQRGDGIIPDPGRPRLGPDLPPGRVQQSGLVGAAAASAGSAMPARMPRRSEPRSPPNRPRRPGPPRRTPGPVLVPPRPDRRGYRQRPRSHARRSAWRICSCSGPTWTAWPIRRTSISPIMPGRRWRICARIWTAQKCEPWRAEPRKGPV